MRSIAETAAKRYDKMFPNYGLQDLPDSPRFVFCATNLGTGSVLRFSKPYTADYRVGVRFNLDLPISTVLAASAAFPPVLSPLRIALEQDQELVQQFEDQTVGSGTADRSTKPDLADTEYAKRLELADGGVYDNIGLQPLNKFHTVLVSDGGGPFKYEPKVKTNWLQHMIRNWLVTDNQVRSLRRSELIAAFNAKRRNGTFWGIGTAYSDYPASVIPVHDGWADYLKAIPTRLHPFDDQTRRQLIAFSYALTDAALRSFCVPEGATIADPVLPFDRVDLAGPPPKTRYEAPPIWKLWK
jgi:NTE family protein